MTFRNLTIFIFLTIGLIVLGCAGGGTAGTGGQRFRGQLTNQNNQPIPGASVVFLQTGDSALTDGQGLFDVQTDLQGGDIQISIEQNASNIRITIPSVSSAATIVEVNIRIDDKNNTGSVQSVKGRDDNGNDVDDRPRGSSSSSSSSGSSSSSSSSGGDDDDDGSSSSSSSSGDDDGDGSGSSSSSSSGDDHGGSSSGSSSGGGGGSSSGSSSSSGSNGGGGNSGSGGGSGGGHGGSSGGGDD